MQRGPAAEKKRCSKLVNRFRLEFHIILTVACRFKADYRGRDKAVMSLLTGKAGESGHAAEVHLKMFFMFRQHVQLYQYLSQKLNHRNRAVFRQRRRENLVEASCKDPA